MYLKILFLWALPLELNGYGYDGYSTCTKPYRNARAKFPDLPCDFNTQSWCMVPGSTYPWHAVRRFVFENHGLMKRMYGEQRHISVLRADMDTNDIEGGVWNRRREESSLNRYDSQPSPPVPTLGTSTGTATASNVTSSTTTTSATSATATTATTTTTSTARPSNVTAASVADVMPPTTTTAEEDVEDGTAEDVTVDDQLQFETTTEPIASTQRTDQVQEQPGFFQESTDGGTDNTQKSKGINACPVKEEVVAPFWANNTRGEVLALLNLYPFEQYVHWERCTFENKQMFCRQGCRCEQQYRLHRLLAYDPSNDCRGIFSDWFRFPSCCVCRCYDLPNDLRITSRSPRTDGDDGTGSNGNSNDLDTWFQNPLNS
ncbi:protein spaetzle 4 isoform X1 [Myzus persicae]|uniref:protein spaetzle 4 isoform X1 n=2 Tax=Myzus persicae TaxID=13164 RepID=UPI000B932CA1|nr:protein spaetzle 4 isoform X1 [Myzus persicae]